MKPFEKYLSNRGGLREFLDAYLELRQHFQEINFSEEDLERPPMYTERMMTLSDRMTKLQRGMKKSAEDFGLDISWEEFGEFLRPYMQKINDLTPLKDGNTERTDSRDKDYQ